MFIKNGKFFGKLNVLDLCIIVILLLAVAFAVFKTGILSPAKAAGGQKIQLVFSQEEAPTYAANNVKIGDPVSEKLANVSFGKVTDIEIGPSISFGKNKNGTQVRSTKDGYSSVRISTEAIGIIGSNGVTIGGTVYRIGQQMVIYVGTSVFYGRIIEASQL